MALAIYIIRQMKIPRNFLCNLPNNREYKLVKVKFLFI